MIPTDLEFTAVRLVDLVRTQSIKHSLERKENGSASAVQRQRSWIVDGIARGVAWLYSRPTLDGTRFILNKVRIVLCNFEFP